MNDSHIMQTTIKMELNNNVDNRKFTRITIRAKSRITTGSQIIEGELENLCLNGAFVKTDKYLDINSPVLLTIFYTLTSEVTIEHKAKVITVTKNGIGLQFMDLL